MPAVNGRTATESPPSRPSENLPTSRGLDATHFELFGLAACSAIDPADLAIEIRKYTVNPARESN